MARGFFISILTNYMGFVPFYGRDRTGMLNAEGREKGGRLKVRANCGKKYQRKNVVLISDISYTEEKKSFV